jgi:hypothetical protein
MNSQYLTDQARTMDGQKGTLDLKCHQMKVKSGVRAVGFPDHATNPSKREKLNGLLAVDAVSGEEFLRLRLLHHLPSGTSIEQVEKRLLTFFETQQLQTQIQILNTIQHIYNLIPLSSGGKGVAL